MNISHQLDSLILAAGYGTRLGSYGEKTPKGLIPYKSSTIIDHLITQIYTISNPSTISIITNQRFFDTYSKHIYTNYPNGAINVINNGSTTPQNQLGALGDIIFSAKKSGFGTQPLFVAASDTVFSFPLTKLAKLYQTHSAFTTAVFRTQKSIIKNRLGCVTLNHDQIIDFTEKPSRPSSDLAGIPFYIYHPRNLKQLELFVGKNHATDAPGAFIPWLLESKELAYAYQTTGFTLDVGTQSDIVQLNSRLVKS